MNIYKLEDLIREVLRGIDQAHEPYAWWDSDAKAEFGKEKLEQLLQIIKDNF